MDGARWLGILRSIPYADRRDTAAGYAMGLVAALAAVAWYAGAIALRLADGVGPVDVGTLDLALGGSVFVAPVGVATAFCVGSVLWRRFAPTTPDPRRGALLGGATALSSLALGSLGLGLFGLVLGLRGESLSSVLDVVVTAGALAALAFVFAVLFAGWFLVPVGALAGWYHERALRRAPSDAAVVRSVE